MKDNTKIKNFIDEVINYLKEDALKHIAMIGWDGNEVAPDQKVKNDKLINWFETRMNYLSTGTDVCNRTYTFTSFIYDLRELADNGLEDIDVIVHILTTFCDRLDNLWHHEMTKVDELETPNHE